MLKNSTVRRMNHDDLSMVLAWRNHPDVRRFMFTQHEIALHEHQQWFAKVSQDATRCLLIVENELEPIGFVQFNNVSVGGVADWGFYASPTAPKGSGRLLGTLSLTYAFEELQLHKVCGQAIESNDASIGFHKSLGFAVEGALRDQQRIQGTYHTLICFGLLAHEWRAYQIQRGNNDVKN